MRPHQEIELTARCTEDEFKSAQGTLLGLGARRVDHRKRFMVRLFIDEVDITSKIDLRVKWTDGEEKITFKRGAVGTHERTEIEIPMPSGHFFGALKLFEALGYERGLAMVRDITRYTFDDLEISFIAAGDTYYIEIEYGGDSADAESVKGCIRELFRKVHLNVLSAEEYRDLIIYLDEKENLSFLLSELPNVLTDDPKRAPLWREVTNVI